MKSRYITNIVLLLLIAGLFWFNQQPSTTISKYAKITSIDKSTITSIVINQPDSVSIKLQKTGGSWQVVAPFNAVANNTRIALLLSIVDMPSYSQLPATNTINLNQFGLNEQSLSLELNNLHFKFGDTETLSNNRYVLFNNSVHLIPDKVFPLLRASANSFIENKLIAKTSKLKKLSLPLIKSNGDVSEENSVIELIAGHWSSKNSTMTTDQLTLLIANWQNLYASQVIPSKPSDMKLQEHQTIRLWFDGNIEPRIFDLDVTDKLLSLRDQETELNYHFPISQLNLILPTK